MKYSRASHSATKTEDYVFSQLIPYIGNKRKLLPLIGQALAVTSLDPKSATLLDTFAGTGVVSRYAKALGYSVIANDWEPYSEQINLCHIVCPGAPLFDRDRSYADVIDELNALPPREDWITRHLCPDDDVTYDIRRDRMFYMRKNGMRLDAIRHQISEWEAEGRLEPEQKASLIAPLLYSASYNSNTSGLFKGFHNGWGGQTRTALDRIMGDVVLRPATFFDNGRDHRVTRMDATALARHLAAEKVSVDVAYLDPPYNQHPYGSNYHVLNSVALWDKPKTSPKITGHGDKSAIRLDWRTERRSAYNHKKLAAQEYAALTNSLDVRWTATSYSTDGTIDIREMVRANHERGRVSLFFQGYKRYRVSTQRPSEKPMNVEFVLLTETGKRSVESVDAICHRVQMAENSVLASHPELAEPSRQTSLLDL